MKNTMSRFFQQQRLRIFSSRGFGFTLIELLVVISVIGILAGLMLSSYGGAQKQARDSQRRSDLNQYRNALEVYASSNNMKYPSYTSAVDASTSLCTSLGSAISACPTDPVSTDDYQYKYISSGEGGGSTTATDYKLWGKLETGGYWEVCSSGKAGKVDSVNTSSSSCDLL